MKANILLLDDDSATVYGLSRYLARGGYNVRETTCLREARSAIASLEFHIALIDLILPDGNGIDLIEEIREIYPSAAIIVITGAGDIPVAVEAMRRGADNFMTKPVNMADLDMYLRKSHETIALRRKDLANKRLKREVRLHFGASDVMTQLRELALMASESDSPLLLQGETGTGKSMLAKWVHENSPRSHMSFVEVSCSNLTGELLSSELFGHVKGAFTSAIQDRQGLIELADGGTLFLDEIADMESSIQAQFLKVLEEKQYRRLGESKIRKSDFRVICATNRNLEEEVGKDRFRSDLYYRISTFPVCIPSLRERVDDLGELAVHILRQLDSPCPEVTADVIEILKAYSWPGNIRELKNILERALILSRGERLGIEHFPIKSRHVGMQSGEPTSLEQMERESLIALIKRCHGNKKKAAEDLGISRSTLYRMLKHYQGKIH